MIKYNLLCAHGHEFEIWFSKSSDFDDQTSKRLVECPVCRSTDVSKAIMAPNISTSRKSEAIRDKQRSAMKIMNQAASHIRREIESQCDYVGDRFAEEARAVHYGEKEERGLYGTATPQEASALSDEGIDITPLPDIIAPKPKTDVN